MPLLAHLFGNYGAAGAAAAAWFACKNILRGASMPNASSSRLAAAFPVYVWLSAGYWLPAIRACAAVGAAMLRCPSVVQLPAALLARPILPHLLLCIMAGDRWLASVVTEITALRCPPPYTDLALGVLELCNSVFGRWPATACRHLLYLLQPQVGESAATGTPLPTSSMPASSC